MRPLRPSLSPAGSRAPLPLPGLRPGVVMVGEGDDAEIRDLQLGQVVKLGEVASIIVALLDGTRDAEALLSDAGRALGEELNPMGLVELLQALDRRALLDTPRARVVVAQGLVRADIAALQRLARRSKVLRTYSAGEDAKDGIETLRMAEGSAFACHSCNRCCSEQHLLGPLTRAERDVILEGFAARDDHAGSDPSNFIPLPTRASEPVYLLRPRDGRCSYLGEDRLCRVHRDLGEEAKPAVCRMFPYRAVRTPTGWDVGMSLSCPTVAAGRGPDPKPEVRGTLEVLRGVSKQLHEVPPVIALVPGISVAWPVYQEWQTEALALLLDEDSDPAVAWVEAVAGFAHMISHGSVDPDFESTVTIEAPETTDDDDDDDDPPDFVPPRGIGSLADDETEAADILVKELAFWAELLVGLEAADPNALRRFRSGMLRLRAQIAFAPEAAPVLAEMARLELRQLRGTSGFTPPYTVTDELTIPPTDPVIPAIPPASTSLQRRFLMQALMEKRPLEYGTAGRGLLALTVFLAVLRLEELPGDEMHPRLEDVSYLLHHPQLTDILDTRAIVRTTDGQPGLHAAILGL